MRKVFGVIFITFVVTNFPLALAQQQDWLARCWTINVQRVSGDMIFIYPNSDSRVTSSLIGGNSFDEQEMTRCVYSRLYGKGKPEEENDFVAYAQTIPDNNSYPAYFLRAMNASPGLGLGRYDRSFMFGSKGRLLGVINTGFSIVNLNAELQNIHFDELNHEISHTKCCYAGHQHYEYINAFGDGFGHWSRYLGRNARGEDGPDNCSVMRASPYVELGNGDAQTRNCHYQSRPTINSLEMYLWGFKNADASKGKQFPSVSSKGTSISHDIYRAPIEKWLTIDDLIAKMDGEVVWPSAEISPKHLRVLFALVIMPGTDNRQLQAMQNRWQEFARLARGTWNEATGGVSTLNNPSKPNPTMLVSKDYLGKWDFSYHPGEWLVLNITGAVPNQWGILVGFDGKNQYSISIKSDETGKAAFSALLLKDHIGTWSAVVHFGDGVTSNVITFEVTPPGQ
ncbi:MAG: hypothetical protein HYS51_00150 [Candidatus Zambryskibacteria bacterium]|nr:hypothetical protein [Candidatus Zambryskibacteria bacterium]